MLEKNEFGETWEKVDDYRFIEEMCNVFKPFRSNRFWLDDMFWVVKNEVDEELPKEWEKRIYVLDIHLGKNGNGDWNEYLTNMNSIFYKLKEKFKTVYLLDWKNDCADDVSYARIVVRDYIIKNNFLGIMND